MRLRHVKNAQEIVESEPNICFQNPEEHKGAWRKAFSKEKEKLYIEVGTGKGKFLLESALQNPEIGYVGIEMMTSVIVRALQKIKDSQVENFVLINKDGANLLDYFEVGEVDKLFLNFPDPWPKKRHEKRRLTSPSFLEKYKQIVKKNGEFRIHTDNYDLYQYSIETLSKVLIDMTYGEATYDENTPTTEFEDKFRSLGQPIYFIEGKFNN